MNKYSHGATQVYDAGARWCLTGDAGIFLDPLYSSGLDLVAIGNGLITDMITRDLDGEDVTGVVDVLRAAETENGPAAAGVNVTCALPSSPVVVESALLVPLFADQFSTTPDSGLPSSSVARMIIGADAVPTVTL